MADTESDPDFDQCKPNQCVPNIPVSVEELQSIGICYWKMPDVDKYDYPALAVPYDPKDTADPKLQALRDSRGYSYADIITVHPDHLPNFNDKIKAFFEEHIHDAEEIRYALGGSGYFDVRDLNDRWVRICIEVCFVICGGLYYRVWLWHSTPIGVDTYNFRLHEFLFSLIHFPKFFFCFSDIER